MAAGTRITKGLVLIFTLLSLVCFMSSLSDKDKLTKVKERHQQTMEDLEKLKNKKNLGTISVTVAAGGTQRRSEYFHQVMQSMRTQNKTRFSL
ncbi:hypothetical protein ATANTOWER_018267 [Ataeniobius toweri]|uniref:Uncharacterized protein n=1 Tax=Ataeniobius toweri TaxID=208326 RepID=A0ABU7AQB0_9TELE|nr:hypothetical protein [Ataeniobius toweri]